MSNIEGGVGVVPSELVIISGGSEVFEGHKHWKPECAQSLEEVLLVVKWVTGLGELPKPEEIATALQENIGIQPSQGRLLGLL